MNITGNTRVYFVLADPIEQVRAPEVFNQVFQEHGIDAVLVPLQVRPADLAATIRALLSSPATGGLLLSIPHKHAALHLVDRCSPGALRAQAINAIRVGADGKLEGDLFDGAGFLRALDYGNIDYRQRNVMLIGAGGAASAIAFALAADGVAAISIYDPATDKAVALAASLRASFAIEAQAVASNDPRGHALVINASPLGLQRDDAVPFNVALLDADAAVFDVLMKNQPTPLLRAAHDRGWQAEPGFEMLIQQTPLYLEFFGHSKAAQGVAANADAIRKIIYPPDWQLTGSRKVSAAVT